MTDTPVLPAVPQTLIRTHRRTDSDGATRTTRENQRFSPYEGSPPPSPKSVRGPVEVIKEAPPPEPPAPRRVAVDCAICQSPIEDPTVGGGCAHHFCWGCYVEWTARSNNCPTCRAPVWALSKDTEYANAIGAPMTPSKASPSKDLENISVDFRTVKVTGPAGVTLINNPAPVGGCIVKRLQPNNGAALAGVRTGDVIVAVNGQRISNHSQAVTLIDARTRTGDLELMVATKRTSRFVPSSLSPLADLRLARRRPSSQPGSPP